MTAYHAEEGPYRLRRPGDALWPPRDRAYGGQVETVWRKVAWAGLGVARLVLPVTLLITLLAAAYLYSDIWFAMNGTATNATVAVSDLILPMTWFAIHLTNRRYGAGYAFAQLVAALAMGVGFVLFNPSDIDHWMAVSPLLTARAIIAFCGAFFLANAIAIVFFDGARGPRWWTAPMTASFAAAFVFSAVYYPAAFAGADTDWTDSALTHFLVFAAESILLLIPYYLLRSAMRPLPGLNGY
ncbi:MAG TPA: hypothetical protein VHV26_04085 [Rhizomicrobium sp.]|jgi:hypothetical protein|nr:hypothetical protein [Rhizomicrobium sp.]